MAALQLLMLLYLVAQSAASTHPGDVAALRVLFQARKSTPGLILNNWSLDEDADPCGSRWKGIGCFQSHRVVSLDLSNTGLTGSIPPEIGDLQKLQHLDLSGNPRLTAVIPKEIGNLHHLTTLMLSNCSFSSKIPCPLKSLHKLKSLQQVYGNRRHLRELPQRTLLVAPTKASAATKSGKGQTVVAKVFIIIGVVAGALFLAGLILCFFCRWRTSTDRPRYMLRQS